MSPKISIIVPCYNKGLYISETVMSIIDQTFSDWELILIDDCSVDNTKEIIKDFEKSYSNIKLIENECNKGANRSRNKGLEIAKGDYVLFFDADDLMTKTCLEIRLQKALKYPKYNMWIFNMGTFTDTISERNESSSWLLPLKKNISVDQFLKHQIPFGTPQVVWKKSFIKQIGGFNPTFKRLQDVELHTRALLHDCKFITFPKEPIDVYYRIEVNRLTSNKEIFYQNYADAAILYYNNFLKSVPNHFRKILVGTLFEVISTIIYQKRINTIEHESVKLLVSNLINSCKFKEQRIILTLYVKIENLIPVHPKGLKFTFKKLLRL